MLLPDVFVEFVGAEAHGADDGSGDEGVVDAAEELHDALFFNDIGDRPHHTVLGLHLHVHFNCVEGVAGEAADYTCDRAAGKILKELPHP